MCCKVMFIRDKKAWDNIQFGTVTHAGGVQINEGVKVAESQDLPFYKERTNDWFRPLRVKY